MKSLCFPNANSQKRFFVWILSRSNLPFKAEPEDFFSRDVSQVFHNYKSQKKPQQPVHVSQESQNLQDKLSFLTSSLTVSPSVSLPLVIFGRPFLLSCCFSLLSLLVAFSFLFCISPLASPSLCTNSSLVYITQARVHRISGGWLSHPHLWTLPRDQIYNRKNWIWWQEVRDYTTIQLHELKQLFATTRTAQP